MREVLRRGVAVEVVVVVVRRPRRRASLMLHRVCVVVAVRAVRASAVMLVLVRRGSTGVMAAAVLVRRAVRRAVRRTVRRPVRRHAAVVRGVVVVVVLLLLLLLLRAAAVGGQRRRRPRGGDRVGATAAARARDVGRGVSIAVNVAAAARRGVVVSRDAALVQCRVVVRLVRGVALELDERRAQRARRARRGLDRHNAGGRRVVLCTSRAVVWCGARRAPSCGIVDVARRRV